MYAYPTPQDLAYPARVLFTRGASAFGSGAGSAPGDVPRKHALGRPWVSVRPVIGSATEVGWTGTGERREIAGSQVAGSADQGLKERRDGASKGVAVCLYFPAIRETSRGCYQGASFGAPPPSLLSRARSTETPIHARDLRAAMTLGWKNDDVATTHNTVIARLDRATQ